MGAWNRGKSIREKEVPEVSSWINDIVGIEVGGGCFAESVPLVLFPDANGRPDPDIRISTVFGRNGSGKTTIARAFEKAGGARFVNGAGGLTSISSEEAEQVKVFSEDYTDSMVRLREDGLESIVMLGEQVSDQEEIDAVDEQLRVIMRQKTDISSEIAELREGDLSPVKLEAQAKRLAKDGGWSRRGESVSGRGYPLTTARWNKVLSSRTNLSRGELQTSFENSLRQLNSASALEDMILGTVAKTSVVDYDEAAITKLLRKTVDEPVLGEREKRLIALLESDDRDLVHRSRRLFDGSGDTVCPMCQQIVAGEYRESLVSSLETILSDAVEEFGRELEEAKLHGILHLPQELVRVVPDGLQSRHYRAVEECNAIISAINALLEEHRSNPYQPIEMHQYGLEQSLAKLNEASGAVNSWIVETNTAFREKESIVEGLLATSDHIAWIDCHEKYDEYLSAKDRLAALQAKMRELDNLEQSLTQERGRLESQRNSRIIAADVINAYLRFVFFDRRRIELVADGPLYRLRVQGKPVSPSQVSTGERDVLALCHFFSSLGQGSTIGDASKKPYLLFIDDPISSYDMENRVGIHTLLRDRLADLMEGCADTKVIIATHDITVAQELDKVCADLGHPSIKVARVELLNGGTRVRPYKHGEYQALLRRAFQYGASEEEDLGESLVIGNILRRVLEAYSSFNYSMDFKKLTRDTVIAERLGDLSEMLSVLMFRLVDDGDSHMQDAVKAQSPGFSFEKYSYEEKESIARATLLILGALDGQHLDSHLKGIDGVAPATVQTLLQEWRAQFSSAPSVNSADSSTTFG